MRYLLCVSYNGFLYNGWAKQPNLITIQSVLEKKLSLLFNENINIIGAARTDKHVHAFRQYCHFDTDRCFFSEHRLVSAINRLLPDDIQVQSVTRVDSTFHARFCTKSKIYLYLVNTCEFSNVFQRGLVYQYCKKIDLEKCKEMVKLFIGRHNFSSFTTEIREPAEREIYDIQIFQKKNLCFFVFFAPSFLRAMVRMLVGTILAYNEDRIKLKDVQELLIFPRKGKAKFKVPGDGLYLIGINY